ncbi:MAG: transglycosylase domain-containing protein [Nostocoides sp.]
MSQRSSTPRAVPKAVAPGGRTKSSTSRPKGRRWPKRLLWTVLSLAVLGILSLVAAYVLIGVPTNANAAAQAQATTIYYSDGKTPIARISEVNRESVPLSKVPIDVQRTFLAAEDRSFYTNSGVSPSGIARAVKAAVTGGATVGGSTITQQYVKNYYLTQDQTVTRKLKEIMISLKLDRQLTKDQILDNYLNTIYFGRGASGIQTAAQAYFHVDADTLTVAQGALLASVIRGPSFYDPSLGPQQTKLAQGRWNYVMDGMVTKGWLTQAQRDAATFPTPFKPPVQASTSGTNGYLVDQVKKELLGKLQLTDAEIDRDGLKVVTTIDLNKQSAAVTAMKKLPTNPTNLHAGLLSIQPGNGAVLAMYGGPDFQKRQFNDATDATIQAGSTFKIFALIAALQNGVSLQQTYSGASPQFFPQFKDSSAATDFLRRGGVKNFDNEQFGTINLIDATAHSVNSVFAQVNLAATPKNTTAAAAAAGVTTKMTSVYANVFGTDNVKVIDMANAYATLAANGLKSTPYFVKSISASVGDYSYTAKPETKQVFDKPLVADVLQAMQAVIQRGTGSYAGARLDRPAAGKTGTTTDNYGAWFDGFTPNLATAVGIYKGDGSSANPANMMDNVPGVGQLTGGTVPVWIWTAYMTQALKGLPVVNFPAAANINKPTNSPPPSNTVPPTTSTTSATSAPPTTSTSSPPTTTQSPLPTETLPTVTVTDTKTHGPPTSSSTTTILGGPLPPPPPPTS